MEEASLWGPWFRRVIWCIFTFPCPPPPLRSTTEFPSSLYSVKHPEASACWTSQNHVPPPASHGEAHVPADPGVFAILVAAAAVVLKANTELSFFAF